MIADIRGHRFRQNDRLFIDANVWLDVYGPVGYQRATAKAYSRAVRDIRSSGCEVFLDALVLSEFINRFARIEQERLAPACVDFKAFRQTPDFKGVASDIASTVTRIAKACCRRCSSEFENTDIYGLMAEFDRGESDFNDLLIREVCKRNSLTLVTHDADFSQSGVDILTANRKLLRGT